jgi:cytochrome c peroxidase
MRIRARLSITALGMLVVLSACYDAPTSLDPGEPQFNRGQSKKGNDPPSTGGDMVLLGKRIFEDRDLSVGRNQSCQSCHEPSEGFAAPLAGLATRGSVVEGSVSGRFGDRKPPSAAYATLAPLYSGGNNPTGGNFWDGRATGHLLGNPAADQALGPFLNPVEQGLPDMACVVYRMKAYGTQYTDVWGAAINTITFPDDVETVCTNPSLTPLATGGHVSLSTADREQVKIEYDNVALSIAAFEGSPHVNRFNSRFDMGQMTALEQEGEKLFGSKGKCQQCHSNKGSQALFTDFAFHNLGVPKNPANPVYHYGTTEFDPGLAGFTGQARHMGKFRTPTTRNVALGRDGGSHRTYMHNGALVSLEKVVDFYNTRDVLPTCTDPAVIANPVAWGSLDFGGVGCWPAPEHGANIDSKNMGKLGLTKHEVEAIVAYMKAMSDQ